ncbi:MAG: universal stress protein [Planctomycetota bacterium]
MKILLASDGSADAKKAAQFVKRLAERNPVDVNVLTASCAPDPFGQNLMPVSTSDWEQAEKQQVERLHAELTQLLQETCDTVVTTRKVGPVSTLILDESVAIDADLIVLGACGHSVVHRMLLGSISDYVATHAKCSVVVVRGDEDRSACPKRVLAAYDRSKGSREAISEVTDIRWTKDVHLDVVSVAPTPIPFESDPFSVMDYSWEPKHVETIRTAAERIASQAAERIPDCSVQVARSNHAGDAILQVAEESRSDLLFVGDTGHSLLDEWLLGSTSKYLLRHAPCSVWISRHHRNGLRCLEDAREREAMEC